MPLLASLPLSTRGADITGADGRPVRLAGVNLSGAQCNGMVPAGLDQLHRDEIARRIAGAGFNHVRLPYATGAFMNRDGTVRAAPAAPAGLAANPDLIKAKATPWQVYQAVTESLTAAGLAVIVNQHLHFPGWCCSDADLNGLWYNDAWPSSVFTDCWLMIARQFAPNPLVIGADVHNEPRPAVIGGVKRAPAWGSGDPAADMRLLYVNTGNRIHAVAPGWLIICEGLSYAGDLTAAGQHPVTLARPGKVVYSLHEYSWFRGGSGKTQTQAQYSAALDRAGGYLQRDGIAPVWVGETGTDNTPFGYDPAWPRGGASPSSAGQARWFANWAGWARQRRVHWCWWQWGATQVQGIVPGTNERRYAGGEPTVNGIAAGQDWQGTSAGLLGVLQALM